MGRRSVGSPITGCHMVAQGSWQGGGGRDADVLEREGTGVRPSGAATPRPCKFFTLQRAAAERAAAEDRHRHRLRLPRRPAWDETTTPEQLDAQVGGKHCHAASLPCFSFGLRMSAHALVACCVISCFEQPLGR